MRFASETSLPPAPLYLSERKVVGAAFSRDKWAVAGR